MKILSRIVIGAALIMLVASAQPAQAACVAPYRVNPVDSGTGAASSVAGNPEWCGAYGCAYEVAVSPQFQAFFWSLGTGDPALGAGDDNGGFPAQEWIAEANPVFGDYPGGYFYGYAAYFRGINSEGDLTWSTSAAIDGCILNQSTAEPPRVEGTCMCIAVNDVANIDFGSGTPQPAGSLAVISAAADPNGIYDVSRAGGASLIAAPIPKADVTGSVRNAVTFDIDRLGVVVPALEGGDYQKDGCNCVVGYKVYGQLLPSGSAPPTDRNSTGWDLLNLDGGAPQTVTAIGSPLDLELLGQCATNQDLYLGVAIVMDSGYETPLLSRDSTQIECGPVLANPDAIRPNHDTVNPQRRSIPRDTKRGR